MMKRNSVIKENVTYKKDLLPYKENLLTYTKKDQLANTKNPRQITTANSCTNFPQEVPAANSRDKQPRQIFAANSHTKFSRQISTANPQMCNVDGGVKYPLRGRASCVKIKRKQVTKEKFIKA